MRCMSQTLAVIHLLNEMARRFETAIIVVIDDENITYP